MFTIYNDSNEADEEEEEAPAEVKKNSFILMMNRASIESVFDPIRFVWVCFCGGGAFFHFAFTLFF